MVAKRKSAREARRDREEKAALDALKSAGDYAATVAAVYSVVWFHKTGNQPPESAAIRCAGNLAAWFADCPEVATAEARQRAAAVFGVDADAVELTAVSGELRLRVSNAGDEVTDTTWREVNRAACDDRKPHPLGPVVTAYQERHPVRVKPKGRSDPIFPLELLRRADKKPEVGDAVMPPFEMTKGGATQARLFDLVPGDESMSHVYLPLHIMEAGMAKPGSSRVTPLPTRLWLESIFDANLSHGGRTQEVVYRLRELMDIVYPNDWKPTIHLPLLRKAVRTLNQMSLPMFIDGKWREVWPVLVRELDLDMDDPRVHIEVRLPQGSERGAMMPRMVLRKLAMESSVLHRSLMNLHFRFHRARHPVPKDAAGKSAKRGAWMQAEDAARYERLLTADGNPANREAGIELMRIVFPYNAKMRRRDRNRNPQVAAGTVMQLAERGLVRVVDGVVLPPPARRDDGGGKRGGEGGDAGEK